MERVCATSRNSEDDQDSSSELSDYNYWYDLRDAGISLNGMQNDLQDLIKTTKHILQENPEIRNLGPSYQRGLGFMEQQEALSIVRAKRVKVENIHQVIAASSDG